jgi:hypothetical protein
LSQQQGSVELPVVTKEQTIDSHLVTFKRIEVSNQTWFMLLVLPIVSISSQINAFSRMNAIWVVGLAMVTLTACLLFVMMEYTSRKAGYQKGILNGIVIAIESVRKHISSQDKPKKHQTK